MFETLIRCDMELPNCSVVLNRITDEEIHRLCASSGNSKPVNGVRGKSGVKGRKWTHCGMKHRKLRREKQATAKTKAINEFQIFKSKRKSFKTEETAAFQSDNSLCWSPVEIESEGRKKRRQKLEKVFQTSDSSVNNAVEAVVNAGSNYLKSDTNSTLQNSNPSSQCNLRHHVESLTFDLSVNRLKEKQNNSPGQSCGIISNPKLHYSFSAFEDIPLSTLKNMYDLMAKKNQTLFSYEMQSSDDKKAKSLRRKRKKLKISSPGKKSCFDVDNLDQSIKKNATEIQQLDGSVERKGEVCRICSSLSSTGKKSETTFPLYRDSGPHTDWDSEKSVKSSNGTICTFCCNLRTDSLPSNDCNSDKGHKSKEGMKTKRGKEAESRVPKVLKNSKTRGYFVQKARKTSLKVNEADEKPGQVTRRGRKKENLNSKTITNNATKILIKTNEPTKKSKHREIKIQNNEDKTSVSPVKQNKNGQTPWDLILNKMIEDNQTVQTLDKTTSNDIRNDINYVNATGMQREPYSSRSSCSKDVRDDSISVTQANLNTTLPQNNVSLDRLKYPKIAKSNASFKPNQSNFAVYLQHQNKLLVGDKIKSEQFKESFGEKTADKVLDRLTFPDSPEKCHLQDKKQTFQCSEMLISDNICKFYDINKTPESTVIKDAYSFSSNSPSLVSNVHANCLNTQVYFRNKISPQIDLIKFTSRPQCDNKTSFNNTVSNVKNIKVSATKPSKISPLQTFSVLPLNFCATDVPVNKNVNKILLFKNNSSPIFISVNSSIPYRSDEKYFSSKEATHSKKARTSNFTSFDSINPQDMEMKISNASGINFLKNANAHLTEFNKTVPSRLDININDLNPKTTEKLTNMPVEKNSCFLSNIEEEPVSEMYSENLDYHFSNDLLKHVGKTSENISSVINILDVVTILAITDLKKNPRLNLNVMITVTKAHLEEVSREKNLTSQLKDQISSIQYNLHILNIAKQYLSLHGSFSKVSDYFLKNYKVIQLENEIPSEGTNASSRWNSESSKMNSLLSDGSECLSNLEVSSLHAMKSFDSYHLHLQETSKEFQSQIAIANNAKVRHYYNTEEFEHYFSTNQTQNGTILRPDGVRSIPFYMTGYMGNE